MSIELSICRQKIGNFKGVFFTYFCYPFSKLSSLLVPFCGSTEDFVIWRRRGGIEQLDPLNPLSQAAHALSLSTAHHSSHGRQRCRGCRGFNPDKTAWAWAPTPAGVAAGNASKSARALAFFKGPFPTGSFVKTKFSRQKWNLQ